MGAASSEDVLMAVDNLDMAWGTPGDSHNYWGVLVGLSPKATIHGQQWLTFPKGQACIWKACGPLLPCQVHGPQAVLTQCYRGRDIWHWVGVHGEQGAEGPGPFALAVNLSCQLCKKLVILAFPFAEFSKAFCFMNIDVLLVPL